jgi:predicted adenylyl cyclase CyaB
MSPSQSIFRPDFMARNIEIKARVASLSRLTTTVSQLCPSPPTVILQDDTFFNCDAGRLKLRVFDKGCGELIFYRREDLPGPKTSRYDITPTTEPERLRNTLTQAYGEAGRVRKHRTLFMLGRTRIHLDQVEGLGEFMELEVVLADGETPEAGIAEAQALMAQLCITPDQLVDQAYVDLLQAPSGETVDTPRAEHQN